MTLQGNHLRIPNADVFKAVILNYSRNPERRFDFQLGVDAEDDPIEAIDVGLEAMGKLDFVLADPEPGAIIEEVGDSNIVLRFSGWIDQDKSDFHKARSLAIRATKLVLEEEGFSLPEPIYRLRIDEVPDLGLGTTGQVRAVAPEAASGDQPAKRRRRKTPEAAFDVAPETHIEEKVESERRSDANQDLLDDDRPVE